MDFDYKIIKSRRRSMTLEVRYGEVIVRSPHLVPNFLIDRFVRSKADWIAKKVKISANHKPPEKIDPVATRQRVSEIAEKTIAKYKQDFNLGSAKITYKLYRSKWGSCSAKNKLSLNLALARMPEKVIEYVVVHELVHTKIKNHSRKFYTELGKYLPDYKFSRRHLKQNHL